MKFGTYCNISATLFSLVALAHLTRLFFGWSIDVDGAAIPMLVSWVGFVIPGLLAVWGYREARRTD